VEITKIRVAKSSLGIRNLEVLAKDLTTPGDVLVRLSQHENVDVTSNYADLLLDR
jgi:hypothetical protein